MATPTIRTAGLTDVCSIVGIESASPNAAHWPELEYQTAIANSKRLVLVAEVSGEVAGFLVASTATEEWELENIAVQSAAQRWGIGRALIHSLISYARRKGAREIRQEIRASNVAAQHFGRAMGFEQEGQRREYYRGPTEDALLFKYLLVRE
jgi:ribosomal-protein-alanine N-acetyltransferase